MNEDEEEIQIKDISKGLKGLVLMWALGGFVVAMLLMASFSAGQEKGYNIVKNYYENYYINEYCICYNTTQETDMKIVLPALEGLS